jgi:hypothetical protein
VIGQTGQLFVINDARKIALHSCKFHHACVSI